MEDLSNRKNLLQTTPSVASGICQSSVSDSSDSDSEETNQRSYSSFWHFRGYKSFFFNSFLSFYIFFKIDVAENVLVSSEIIPNRRTYRSQTIDTISEPERTIYPTRRLSCSDTLGKAKDSIQTNQSVKSISILLHYLSEHYTSDLLREDLEKQISINRIAISELEHFTEEREQLVKDQINLNKRISAMQERLKETMAENEKLQQIVSKYRLYVEHDHNYSLQSASNEKLSK